VQNKAEIMEHVLQMK